MVVNEMFGLGLRLRFDGDDDSGGVISELDEAFNGEDSESPLFLRSIYVKTLRKEIQNRNPKNWNFHSFPVKSRGSQSSNLQYNKKIKHKSRDFKQQQIRNPKNPNFFQDSIKPKAKAPTEN